MNGLAPAVADEMEVGEIQDEEENRVQPYMIERHARILMYMRAELIVPDKSAFEDPGHWTREVTKAWWAERLLYNLLLMLVLPAFASGQAFPRVAGHRTLQYSGLPYFTPQVSAEIAQYVGAVEAIGRPVFYCAKGHMQPDGGVLVQSIQESDTTGPPPLCNDSMYVGGVTILPQPIPGMDTNYDLLGMIFDVLRSRDDFVFLAVVDSVITIDGVDKPHTHWILYATEPPR